jgi:hypothetical protein
MEGEGEVDESKERVGTKKMHTTLEYYEKRRMDELKGSKGTVKAISGHQRLMRKWDVTGNSRLDDERDGIAETMRLLQRNSKMTPFLPTQRSREMKKK